MIDLAVLKFAVPAAWFISVWRWLRGKFMPRPQILTSTRKSQWGNDPECVEWAASFGFKKGWLCWKRQIENCRLFLIRKDFGPLDSPPEGIWLKWIEDGVSLDDLAITMVVGKTYEAILVVRDSREDAAYITNEGFITTGGNNKKWKLPSGRTFPIDPNGRFTFWLEIRIGKKAYRSEHYYVLCVPPAGVSNDEFKLETLYEPILER